MERTGLSKLCLLLTVAPVLIFGTGTNAMAAHKWAAISNFTMAFTGNVTLTKSKLLFQHGQSLSLKKVATGARFHGEGRTVRADIYKATPPKAFSFHGNVLCGGKVSKPATYIAVWKSRPILSDVAPVGIAIFSGSKQPTNDETQNACGSFRYKTKPDWSVE